METEKLAAGGIVIEKDSRKRRVLLVHRSRYDDWSFPKGKLEANETVEEAALREVREETGLECRIIRELAVTRYNYRTRSKGNLKPKAVYYFLMEHTSGVLQNPGEEVDRAEWFEFAEARQKLSYAQDRELLDLV